ncbi:SIMPL domain-containing protein [Cobetia crustatorum]|uniref:DUF541 domain-containing protein n=1 Tax=Cobetia crustatorum TaxID=553385 RepID=A0A558HXM7_9GAMM|nr:SIMPL domain-containing protein [Cobetia crustatorum]TVU73867.1 DUF541 domain-containing protein [Cobetia crustatorum]
MLNIMSTLLPAARPVRISRNTLALSLGMTLTALSALGTAHANQTPAPALVNVSASANVEAAPDKASIEARLWEKTPARKVDDKAPDSKAQGEAARQARETLETRMATLIKALEKAGIDSRQISAGSLNLRPEQYYQRNDSNQDPQQWQRTHLERPISISLTDLNQVPEVIDLLLGAGVNQLAGVQYQLSDRDALEDKVLKEALLNARHKAELMAQTLGATLGAVQSINESSNNSRPPMMAMRADMAEAKSSGSEYRPGELSLESNVQVSWALDSAN